jgi:cytochrome P450
MSSLRTHLPTGDAWNYVGCILLVLLGLYILFSIFRNLYIHPLARFPGPLLARSSLVRTSRDISDMLADERYSYGGLNPHELSFGSASSWKYIYGFPSQGQDQMVKSDFYRILRSGFDSGCIGCEQDPAAARRMKTSLSSAFSSKALLEQENIVQRVINQFIARIEIEGGAETIDIVKWLELVAFDLMGEMTFRESFGCITSGMLSLQT